MTTIDELIERLESGGSRVTKATDNELSIPNLEPGQPDRAVTIFSVLMISAFIICTYILFSNLGNFFNSAPPINRANCGVVGIEC